MTEAMQDREEDTLRALLENRQEACMEKLSLEKLASVHPPKEETAAVAPRQGEHREKPPWGEELRDKVPEEK
ncbi:MAG: hypothetical protein WHT84_08990 [Breznakiellaceae bacterium]